MKNSSFQKPGLPRQSTPNKKSMGGYLMVEVMVSMVIILVGITGISKIQNVAKLSNEQAMQRSTAINLVDNLMERIRSNPGGLADYFANSQLTGALTAPATCAADPVCTAAERADWDLYDWEQLLIGAQEDAGGDATGGLVNPIVCLQGPPAPAVVGDSGVYNIAIVWHGRAKLTNQTIAANANASACGTLLADNAYDEVPASNDNLHRRVYWQELFM